MFHRPRRARISFAVAAITGALVLAGCSTDTKADAPTAKEQAQLFDKQCEDTAIPDLPELDTIAAAEGTSTVKSSFGDVELPTKPKAALGMYTTDVDILAWLGYPLASSQPIRGDGGYTTFPCFFPYDSLQGVNTFQNYPDYDYEGVLLAEPDFILNGLGYDKKVVKRLPYIAPTYSVDAYDGRSWSEHFEETAEALGRLDRFEAWKAYYDAQVADVREEIGDKAGDLVVAPVTHYEGEITTGCYVGVECQVFEDLGLTLHPGSLSNDREGETLSAEQTSKLADIDYAFMLKGLGDAGQDEFDASMTALDKNALWTDLGFVKDEHIVTYEFEMTFGSPSGQLAFLEVVRQALTQ